MLESMFVIVLIIALLLLIFSIVFDDHPFWGLSSIFMSITLWFVLAFESLRIEVPYQFYNASSGLAETGSHTYTQPYISYFFMSVAMITLVYGIVKVFEKYDEFKHL